MVFVSAFGTSSEEYAQLGLINPKSGLLLRCRFLGFMGGWPLPAPVGVTPAGHMGKVISRSVTLRRFY